MVFPILFNMLLFILFLIYCEAASFNFALDVFRRERQFKVVIKFAARADLHHLGLFLAGKQADAPQEALQVLDIVLRELPTNR